MISDADATCGETNSHVCTPFRVTVLDSVLYVFTCCVDGDTRINVVGPRSAPRNDRAIRTGFRATAKRSVLLLGFLLDRVGRFCADNAPVAKRRSVDAVPDDTSKDLKAKAAVAILSCNEDLYRNTRNPRHVWHAWQVARQMKLSPPEWVLGFIDHVAASEIAQRMTSTTADRYEAALTAMEVAVHAHNRRLDVRHVAKLYGAAVDISRRDLPNLTAIARVAAKANGVSVNRLLARYRSNLKTSTRG